ncbi:efflux RND transporter permease subunit [Helicobacter ailurogastricus]|uniref:Cobalt-zinc-cadmium resistance protein CzcA Cation efflux system protein CusA n=1 Tax=Helicobacter ailurogastricus TaxID=1578720 RepID=A0A0K2XEU2_9HELI|nr:CusA/CzcA family heavy metal efflux RND transporter [Helicobacter ailurogastricus]CRF41549.1 Cobalt-zinc-cadmium resistance protein CzcA; Cation efflux system protein CusA [Helicobacter ailurogastricus]CRF43264.1 Cobalt-zinc-cadmium resistance protein CzcA; Cation efflux system protein CusA [Helicobacter ailurogastricus]CRF44934.1 Cobalt-zinc-cadmium resistance protein CzcA; Cation efflux system protein CusA [Helicobacter ailurogastricus]
MINTLISLSLKNKLVVLMVTFLLFLVSLWAMKNTRLDALPDLSPTQVVVQVSYPNQSPQVVQEQAVYPLVANFMGIADIETVRGISSYETGLVYIIFKDGVDLYFARDRVSEQMARVKLPAGVKVEMGSDSTSIGWAYQYALTSKTKSLAELKTLQDFYYRYALLGVDGVSEVASVGGFEKNYEVTLDNDALVKYDLSVQDVVNAIKKSNEDTGGGIILENGFEKIIHAKGYTKSLKDLGEIVLKTPNLTPIKLKDVATLNLTPKPRRSVANLNGTQEVVGGIVMVRYHADTYRILERIKAKIARLQEGNPDVKIVPVYDRSELIEKGVDNLIHTLIEESVIVLAVIALFLLHFRSALVVIITLPLCVCLSFLLMHFFNIEASIMSLGGIAIAIGAMVDAAIVMVENAHKHLSHANIENDQERQEAIIAGVKQVGPAIFFALMIIVVSFLPIFDLSGQEKRLFSPLAYTKTFAMLVGALLSISVVPILMLFFIKGKIIEESKNPINAFFIKIYGVCLRFVLRFRWVFLALSVVGLGGLYFVYKKLNWEFIPAINEGVVMYMPVTTNAVGIDTAKKYLEETNKRIKAIPEVKQVFGKAGRANSSTDSAALSMLETYIELKPKAEWPEKITYKQLRDKLEQTLQLKGLVNSWTYPIRGRIDMLLTGIRTPLGIKLYGKDPYLLQELAIKMEQKLKTLPQSLSVFAEKSNNGYYLNVDLRPEKLAQYNLTKEAVLNMVSFGMGGASITTLIDGVESYPISVRLKDTQRNNIESLQNLYIKTPSSYVPLREFANVYYENAPAVLKSEKGLNVHFIYIVPENGVSSESYREAAIKALESLRLPSGYYYEFSGESQYLDEAFATLKYIVPMSIFIIFLLIVFALKSPTNSLLCFFSLPFAFLGGLVFMKLWGLNLSIAALVGFLALLGVASETAIVMIIYLEDAYQNFLKQEQHTSAKLKEAIMHGAVQRVRPKLMTFFSILVSLVPIMYSHGVGSEIMHSIAAPMLGGMITSVVLTLFIIPTAYFVIKNRAVKGG